MKIQHTVTLCDLSSCSLQRRNSSDNAHCNFRNKEHTKYEFEGTSGE